MVSGQYGGLARYRAAVPHDLLPPDPFADDPDDPAKSLDDLDDGPVEPMSEQERADLLADLADLAVFQELLEPRGYRGIVVECAECDDQHYHEWHLLRASLGQLLADGRMRPHEPAYAPDPHEYLTWDYCHGYADGVRATETAR